MPAVVDGGLDDAIDVFSGGLQLQAAEFYISGQRRVPTATVFERVAPD